MLNAGQNPKTLQQQLRFSFARTRILSYRPDTFFLRISAKPLGITRIDASSENIQIQFIPNPPIDPLKIIQLIQSSREYSLSGPDRLKILVKIEDVNKRVMRIKELVQKLG